MMGWGSCTPGSVHEASRQSDNPPSKGRKIGSSRRCIRNPIVNASMIDNPAENHTSTHVIRMVQYFRSGRPALAG